MDPAAAAAAAAAGAAADAQRASDEARASERSEPKRTSRVVAVAQVLKAGVLSAGEKMDFGRVVIMHKSTQKAAKSFKSLVKPQRPPMPGTATPADYVIFRKPTPEDATPLERFRDWLLILGTKPIVAYIQVVWLACLAVSFMVFVACLYYWFDWGYLDEPVYHCTENSTCCECVNGAYLVLKEDYWQEKMTQVLSALFTYATLLALPWRLAILHQLFSQRCRGKSGVDFYGRPNRTAFFHITRRDRMVIAFLLNLAVACQIAHQVRTPAGRGLPRLPLTNCSNLPHTTCSLPFSKAPLNPQILHFVWEGPIVYFETPEGPISLITGPVAGLITGVGAGLIQFTAEDRLYRANPTKFRPGLLAIAREVMKRLRKGQGPCSIIAEMMHNTSAAEKSAAESSKQDKDQTELQAVKVAGTRENV